MCEAMVAMVVLVLVRLVRKTVVTREGRLALNQSTDYTRAGRLMYVAAGPNEASRRVIEKERLPGI
jgi:hypothetical protein